VRTVPIVFISGKLLKTIKLEKDAYHFKMDVKKGEMPYLLGNKLKEIKF